MGDRTDPKYPGVVGEELIRLHREWDALPQEEKEARTHYYDCRDYYHRVGEALAKMKPGSKGIRDMRTKYENAKHAYHSAGEHVAYLQMQRKAGYPNRRRYEEKK